MEVNAVYDYILLETQGNKKEREVLLSKTKHCCLLRSADRKLGARPPLLPRLFKICQPMMKWGLQSLTAPSKASWLQGVLQFSWYSR